MPVFLDILACMSCNPKAGIRYIIRQNLVKMQNIQIYDMFEKLFYNFYC